MNKEVGAVAVVFSLVVGLMFLLSVATFGPTGGAPSQIGSGLVNFIGLTRLVVPADPITSTYVIVGNVSGVMANNTFTNETQILSFFDSGGALRVEIEGFFNIGTVDLTNFTITTTSTSIAVDHTGATNIGSKTFYLNNTLSSGVFVCPSAKNVAETIATCPGVIVFTFAQAIANTTIGSVTVSLVNGTYVISNLTNSGVGENTASAVSAGGGGGGGGSRAGFFYFCASL